MHEAAAHIFDLPVDIPVYIGRQEFVIEYSRGKDVLHLGCVDAGMILNKQQKGVWLHERIHKVANSVWGVDIDDEGLQLMRSQGYAHLYQADIENLGSVPEFVKQDFDLILLTEVMEHLNNPGRSLLRLKPFFKSSTEMLVTVPNATSLGNIIENLKGKELVHPDHNYWYSLHTIQSLFDKHGYDVRCVGVYSQHNFRRSISGHLWNKYMSSSDKHTYQLASSDDHLNAQSNNHPKNPNILGWLRAIALTLSYRVLISRNPFFADGLILVVRPV